MLIWRIQKESSVLIFFEYWLIYSPSSTKNSTEKESPKDILFILEDEVKRIEDSFCIWRIDKESSNFFGRFFLFALHYSKGNRERIFQIGRFGLDFPSTKQNKKECTGNSYHNSNSIFIFDYLVFAVFVKYLL